MNISSDNYHDSQHPRERLAIITIVVILHMVVLLPVMADSQDKSKPVQEMKVTIATDEPVTVKTPIPLPIKPPSHKLEPTPPAVAIPIKEPDSLKKLPDPTPEDIQKIKLEQESALAKAREEAEVAQLKLEQDIEREKAERAAIQAKEKADVKVKIEAEIARLKAMEEAKKKRMEEEAAQARAAAEARLKAEHEAAQARAAADARRQAEQEAARAKAHAERDAMQARVEAEVRHQAEREAKLSKERAEAEVRTRAEAAKLKAEEEGVILDAMYNQKNIRRPYPLSARRAGLQGTVMLYVEVLADGSCGKINVLKSSGYRVLDDNALETVKTWQFIPSRQAGVAVSKWYKLPYVFSLID